MTSELFVVMAIIMAMVMVALSLIGNTMAQNQTQIHNCQYLQGLLHQFKLNPSAQWQVKEPAWNITFNGYNKQCKGITEYINPDIKIMEKN
jgi:hypothetical protein